VLETEELTKECRGFLAVSKMNLRVHRRHIHVLIGPIAAGKTTGFNLVTKVLLLTEDASS
jgi:branched-chain amino acid transport system ATP-binding protein